MNIESDKCIEMYDSEQELTALEDELWDAVLDYDYESVEKLLSLKVNPNIFDHNIGGVSLFRSALCLESDFDRIKEKIKIIKALLEAGANPRVLFDSNDEFYNTETALELICNLPDIENEKYYIEIVLILINHYKYDVGNALEIAMRNNKRFTVSAILESDSTKDQLATFHIPIRFLIENKDLTDRLNEECKNYLFKKIDKGRIPKYLF